MRRVDERISVQVSPGALIFLAVLILMLPLQWVGAVVLAALVHECCHCIAILLLGGRLKGINIGGRGAVIDMEPMPGIREAVCALAGPLGSFLLVSAVQWMPRTAVCGLIHGLYNLLPMLPLDGGRILRGILSTFLSPPTAQRCLIWIRRIVLLLLGIGGLLLASRLSMLPFMVILWYIWIRRRENPLAKSPFWRYNRGTME